MEALLTCNYDYIKLDLKIQGGYRKMTIHILHWIKEDLEGQGKRLEDYTLVEIQSLLEDYKNRYNR